jgi:hypothetical protein
MLHSIRLHTSAYVRIRQRKAVPGSHRRQTRTFRSTAYVCIRPHTSAYVSVRQYLGVAAAKHEHFGAPHAHRVTDPRLG